MTNHPVLLPVRRNQYFSLRCGARVVRQVLAPYSESTPDVDMYFYRYIEDISDAIHKKANYAVRLISNSLLST